MADFFSFDQLQNWAADSATLSPPARLAVIGDPIGHSKSPQMHNPALRACGIDAQYVRVQVPVGRVKQAFALFRQHDFLGVNITIPHKFEALDAVDEVDPLARQLGAVNTLAIRAGRLFGYNTDGPGFLRSAEEAFGRGVQGLRVLILGAGGGAGRAVAVQCALAGAQVVLANRTQAKSLQLRDEINALAVESPAITTLPEAAGQEMEGQLLCTRGDIEAADMIVNATPLGMKDMDLPLIPPNSLEARHLVFDMVYRADREVPLIAAARAAGARHMDGMGMLLHQGAISFEHWFNRPAPLEVMRNGLMQAQTTT